MTPKDFKDRFYVSRETISDLISYQVLLKKWNVKTNLVSTNTISQVWCRHFLDSAQIVDFCKPHNKLWLDIGSGGGFPGVVVAIILRDRGIKADLVLVEKNVTKVYFLKEIRRKLNLSYNIICENIEKIKPLQADIISARAFAPLEILLPISRRQGKKTCVSIFLKGKNIQLEIDKTSKSWFFEYDIYSSMSSDDGRILKIKKLRKTNIKEHNHF